MNIVKSLNYIFIVELGLVLSLGIILTNVYFQRYVLMITHNEFKKTINNSKLLIIMAGKKLILCQSSHIFQISTITVYIVLGTTLNIYIYVYTVAPKSVCALMILIETGLYSLIKINISKWLMNY